MDSRPTCSNKVSSRTRSTSEDPWIRILTGYGSDPSGPRSLTRRESPQRRRVDQKRSLVGAMRPLRHRVCSVLSGTGRRELGPLPERDHRSERRRVRKVEVAPPTPKVCCSLSNRSCRACRSRPSPAALLAMCQAVVGRSKAPMDVVVDHADGLRGDLRSHPVRHPARSLRLPAHAAWGLTSTSLWLVSGNGETSTCATAASSRRKRDRRRLVAALVPQGTKTVPIGEAEFVASPGCDPNARTWQVLARRS